ncbi:MAG TPA: alanine--tRNA ligase-related protein, partial [Candidatus Micrarchaeota archaeon]|nr:alanine--tRNA ligase-related protein [Candidatus Micrarchaeota archaeon]
MTKLLCLEDSYLKECSAKVEKMLSPIEAVLDQTVFYPRGGGQPSDTGKITAGGQEFAVLEVTKKDGQAVHKLDKAGLADGAEVKCVIDWSRRYKLMRS